MFYWRTHSPRSPFDSYDHGVLLFHLLHRTLAIYSEFRGGIVLVDEIIQQTIASTQA